MNDTAKLLAGIRNGDHRLLARSISLVENSSPGYQELLSKLTINWKIPVIGFTGPPGAGKSTLVNGLLHQFLQKNLKIAVIAIDPSSPFNLGALLGDRIRLNEHFNQKNIFIRSLATRGSLGGLSDKILEVTDLLRAAPFDLIFVETVGVGQSEVEIAGLADTTVLILVPESGDEIQTMKAGIMEIADIFVVNKSDRPDAMRYIKNLEMMLKGRTGKKEKPPVIRTVANKNEGLDALGEVILSCRQNTDNERRSYLLAVKAYNLIRAARMSDISKEDLLTRIKEEIAENPRFNMYRFIRKWV